MRQLHVLVVDDHPVNLRYLEITLASSGHKTTSCVDGLRAVQAAREQRFDVVLMDLHMPVMDGEAAIRAIRALPSPFGQMPIYAVSADTADATRDRVRQAGADGFLEKPLSPAHLRKAIAALDIHGATPVNYESAQDKPRSGAAVVDIDPSRLAKLRYQTSIDFVRQEVVHLLDQPSGELASLLQVLDSGDPSEAQAKANQLQLRSGFLGLRLLEQMAKQTGKRAAAGGDAATPAQLHALAAVLRNSAERTRAALQEIGVHPSTPN